MTPRRPALLAAAALVVVALAAAVVVSLRDGGRPQTVRAVFRATDDVRAGDQVRVRGVRVGSVSAVKLLRGQPAVLVTMAIADRRIRVRSDATAHTRWRTLLGGSLYIDLDPGTPTSPPSSRTLTLDHTTSQVQLDQVLDVFGGTTPQAIRTALDQTATGLDDDRAVGRAVAELQPGFDQVARGAPPLLGQRSDDLGELVAATDRTVRAVDAGGAQLERLLRGGALTLGTVEADRRELGETLDIAPGTLDEIHRTMARLQPTLTRTDRLLEPLTPAVGPLAPTLDRARPTLAEADRLLTRLRPALRRLPAAVEALGGAAREGAPLIEALRPTTDRLEDPLLPFLERRDEATKLRNYESIGPTAAAANATAAEFDGGGYVLHFPTLGDERSVLGAPCQTFLTDPSATEKVRCDALDQVLDSIFNPPAAKR